MFYAYAVASMLGYALQGALLVPVARRMDGLTLAFIRNATFAVTLLPLLLLGDLGDLPLVLSHWKLLIVSGIAGTTFLAILFHTYRSLPAGSSNALARVMSTTGLIVGAWIFFQETLRPIQLLIIGLMLAATFPLTIRRSKLAHLEEIKPSGVALILLAGCVHAVTIMIITYLSREADPLVAGYVWEVTCSFITGIFLIFRRLLFKTKLKHRVTANDWMSVAWRASPTLIGTGAFTLAMQTGSPGVVSSIGASSLAVTAILGWKWYGDKLEPRQWWSIGAIIIAMIVLKFV